MSDVIEPRRNIPFYKRWFSKEAVLRDLARQAGEEAKRQVGYEVIFSNFRVGQHVLFDGDRTFKFVEASSYLFELVETTFEQEEVGEVEIQTYPHQFGAGLGKYMAGGMLVGGVAGALIGGVIDSLGGPKKHEVEINFVFDTGGIALGHIYFTAKRRNMELTEHNIKTIWDQVGSQIEKLETYFPGKVRME